MDVPQYPRILSLLARWHQWRRVYSQERGFAHVSLASPADDEEELERLTMEIIEANIEAMSPRDRLALQHIARAECLGVEVIMSARLGSDAQRATAIEAALSGISRRLLLQGIL